MAIATTGKIPNPASFIKLISLVLKIRDMTINLLSVMKTLTKYIFQILILTLCLNDNNTKISFANNIEYSVALSIILMFIVTIKITPPELVGLFVVVSLS